MGPLSTARADSYTVLGKSLAVDAVDPQRVGTIQHETSDRGGPVTTSSDCRPPYPERRRRHRFRAEERRSGFDRRRNICRSPFGIAVETQLVRLRDDPVLLAELLILINVLSAIDLFITFNVLRLGAIELNPVMAYLLDLGPLPATLAKIGTVVAATAGLWLLRRHRAALTAALLLLVTYGTLVTFEMVGMVRMLL
jgi:hypothetical protein